MSESLKLDWPVRLDKFCAIIAGLLPVGIIIGNAAYESMLAIVGLCWIARSIIAKENPIPTLLKQPFILPWVAMYLSILMSLAINGPGVKGLGHDIVFLRHLLFLGAVLDISRRLPIVHYLLAGMAGAVVLAICNVVSANIIGWDLMGKPQARYTSKLKEAARLAGLFSYIGPMFIAWSFSLVSLKKQRRLALFILGVLALVLLVYAHIRTGILAAGAGLLFWLAYCSFKKYSYKSIAFIAPLAAMGAIAVYYYISHQSLTSMYDRFGFYKVVWAVFLEHPVFGVGISAFRDAVQAMAQSGQVTPFVDPTGHQWLATEIMHAHNLPLMILACTGTVGMAIFIWLFFRIVKCVFLLTEEQYRYGLVVWPVILLVIGLTGWNIYANWYHALFVYLTAFSGVTMTRWR